MKPTRNKWATKEFDFEDDNLDLFMIYDYKSVHERFAKKKLMEPKRKF